MPERSPATGFSIFRRTVSGQRVVLADTLYGDPLQRRVLLVVNGITPLTHLAMATRTAEADFAGCASALLAAGLIEVVPDDSAPVVAPTGVTGSRLTQESCVTLVPRTPPGLSTPELDERADGEQLLRIVLRSVLRQVLGNASELGSGSTADEHVHQMRVGLRRLRTALRELEPLAQGIDKAWEAPLADAFSRLGEVRDNEVVAKAVRPLLEQAGAPKVEWAMPEVHNDVGEIARDAKLQTVLLDVLGFASCDAAPASSARSPAQAREHVAARLTKLHKQVVKGGKKFIDLPAVEQHKVRKRLKRLRYLAEFVEALWPDKSTRRYLRHLGPAQDALGAHNDIAVAQAQFRKEASRDPDALFAAGYLQAHLGITAQDAHDALKQVADTPRFWKR